MSQASPRARPVRRRAASVSRPSLSIGDRILERGHRPSRVRLWGGTHATPRKRRWSKQTPGMAPDGLTALAERRRVHALDALEGQVRSSRVSVMHARWMEVTNA
jgi:hypothetical protein